MRPWIVVGLIILSACNSQSSGSQAGAYVLYRNSNFDTSVRVHWATFNARESDPNYNANNCGMAARLLNANLAASAKAEGKAPHPGLGFWCEPGTYSEKGAVPTHFESAFPTDVY